MPNARRGICMLVLLLTLDTVTSTFAIDGDSDLRAAFLAEYTRSYRELVQNYTNVDFLYVLTAKSGAPHFQRSEVEGKFKLHHYLLTTRTKILETQSERVVRELPPVIEGANSKYDFDLQETSGGPFRLRRMNLVSEGARTPFLPLAAPLADFPRRRTFLEIALDPDTQFLSLKDVTYHGKLAKEVRLIASFMEQRTKKQWRMRMTYFFLPEHHWVCVGIRGQPEHGQPEDWEIRCVYDDKGPYPALKFVESSARVQYDGIVHQTITSYEISRFKRLDELPDQAFRLSAFGLPEPAGVTWKKPTPWWLWISLGGVGMLVLGAGLGWLRKRYAARAAV